MGMYACEMIKHVHACTQLARRFLPICKIGRTDYRSVEMRLCLDVYCLAYAVALTGLATEYGRVWENGV